MTIFVWMLLTCCLIFAGLFVLLLWSISDGQMDDLKTPGERAIWDDIKDND